MDFLHVVCYYCIIISCRRCDSNERKGAAFVADFGRSMNEKQYNDKKRAV